jgi:hypothetical protein
MSCKILQINVNRNSITTENILQMAIELNIFFFFFGFNVLSEL